MSFEELQRALREPERLLLNHEDLNSDRRTHAKIQGCSTSGGVGWRQGDQGQRGILLYRDMTKE